MKHRLEQVMKAKGMSVARLSETTGIPVTTIYWMKNDEENISRKQVLDLYCQALEVSIDELLDLDQFKARLGAIGGSNLDVDALLTLLVPIARRIPV